MNNLLKKILVIIILAGGISFSFWFTSPFPLKIKIESELALLEVQEKNTSELPVRLKIPKINIDAEVEYVGLTILGAMDVPKGPAEVAWFKFGPRPGETGSAVIAGHSGWKDGIPAVFDDLNKLEIGDKIYVEDEKGGTINFIVREIRTYTPKQDATDVFGSTDGKSHLNLITCTGFWDSILRGHSDRLIVFTDRE